MRNEVVEQFYRENYKNLVKYARSRVGDYSLPMAEDAVQEAFTRALQYFKAYDNSKPFEGWFKAILDNTIIYIKFIERDRGSGRNEEIVIPKFSIDIEEELKNVNERDRKVFEAYFFYGLNSREIAEILPVSAANVRYLLHHFRKRITND